MSPTASSTSNTVTPGSPSAPSTSPADPLASESTFLTLLVSQLQNQDPLSPVDSNQFVSQLTEYSQLEQLMGINQNTSTIATDVTQSATPAASTTPAAGTTPPATQPATQATTGA